MAKQRRRRRAARSAGTGRSWRRCASPSWARPSAPPPARCTMPAFP